MPSLLVFGEPDIGNTTILKKFMRGRKPVFEEGMGQGRAEVVAVESPPVADEARLYGAILDAIGAPVPRDGSWNWSAPPTRSSDASTRGCS